MTGHPTHTGHVDDAMRWVSTAVYAVIGVVFFIGWSLT